MKTRSGKIWTALAVLSLFALAGTLLLSRATTGCFLLGGPCSQGHSLTGGDGDPAEPDRAAGRQTLPADRSLDQSPEDNLPPGRDASQPDEAPIHPQEDSGEAEMSTDSNVNTYRQIEHADEQSFQQLVLGSEVPVLVDFYADWCFPCRLLAPALEELARETPNVRVVKVNVDENPLLASRYRISSIPAVMVFKDGQVTAQHLGLAGKDELKAMLTL
jgi:thioredoxin 1